MDSIIWGEDVWKSPDFVTHKLTLARLISEPVLKSRAGDNIYHYRLVRGIR